MEWSELLQNLQVGSPFQLGWLDIIIRLVMATFLGFYITFVSFVFYTGQAFRQSIAHAQILLTVICAMIINVIGQNIAWAIGLIGALSFIRFRTNLRDPKDTAIFFYSVGIGIACGAGAIKVAIGGVVVLTLVLFILNKIPFFRTQAYQIKLKGNSEFDIKAYTDYFTLKGWKCHLMETSGKKDSIVFLVFWDNYYKSNYIKELYNMYGDKIQEIAIDEV